MKNWRLDVVATMRSEAIVRLNAANAVLAVIAPGTQLVRKPGGWYVRWAKSNGNVIERRWTTRAGSHYPPWYRHWGHGGTCVLALSQLVRWVRDLPVLPLSSWHHWCSGRVYLARDSGAQVCSSLGDAGWPHHVPCVLCGRELERAVDWWDLNGVSGACCGMSDEAGCCQTQRGNR